MKQKNSKGFRILAFLLLLFLFCECKSVNFHASAQEKIAIDGDFSDWDSEWKTMIDDDYLHSVAFILDGDMMYIYIDAKKEWTAYGVGAHNNGKYVVTTDLGYQACFQLKEIAYKVPGVDGVNGATVAHSNLEWGQDSYRYEIAIPVPEEDFVYLETVSFGFYLQEPVITGITNRQEHQAGETDTIVCDGSFSDWDYYPHPVIYYGMHEDGSTYVEGQAGLYSDGETIYAHVFSAMSAHVENGAKDLVGGLVMSINQPDGELTDETMFLPKFVTVDGNGVIHEADFESLQPGVHEFYVMDMQGWSVDGMHVNYWSDPSTYQYNGNRIHGKAYIAINPSGCEMEFELDIATLAEKYGLGTDEIKFVGAKFQAIGDQWVTCAGVSSGPWLGVLISGLAAALILVKKRMCKVL